jgi:hypothetical protein
MEQEEFNDGSHHKALRLRICPSKNQEPNFLPTCPKIRTLVLLNQHSNSYQMQRSSPHLKLLAYLEDYIQLHGYSPVIDEMMAAMEKPRGAIQNSLKYLEREGYIERCYGKARAI